MEQESQSRKLSSTTKGELPFNAEIFIDWSNNQQVQFTYPYELPTTPEGLQHKKDLAYFAHALVPVFALVAVAINSWFIVHGTQSIISPAGMAELWWYFGLFKLAYPVYMLGIIGTALLIYAFIGFEYVGFIVLFGYISVLLHRNIKWLRDVFPASNALVKKLWRRRFDIDLMKQGGRFWYRAGDKILIPNMSAVECELVIPDSISSHVRSIYSECVSEKPDIMSSNFWLVIILDTVWRLDGKISVRN
jgi:hypothetical protein